MWRSSAIVSFMTSGYLLILLGGEGGHWGFGVASGLSLAVGVVFWMRYERARGTGAPQGDPFDLAVYPTEQDDPVPPD